MYRKDYSIAPMWLTGQFLAVMTTLALMIRLNRKVKKRFTPSLIFFSASATNATF